MSWDKEQEALQNELKKVQLQELEAKAMFRQKEKEFKAARINLRRLAKKRRELEKEQDRLRSRLSNRRSKSRKLVRENPGEALSFLERQAS